jgi:hypothetical protein
VVARVGRAPIGEDSDQPPIGKARLHAVFGHIGKPYVWKATIFSDISMLPPWRVADPGRADSGTEGQCEVPNSWFVPATFVMCRLMRTETVSNLGGHAARRKGRRARASATA